MTPRTLLRLGRVSNLPTVWSNALAGAALVGALAGGLAGGLTGGMGGLALAALALTLAYVAGMWLNDAFDAEIDARERPSRPIPAGEISCKAVFAGGWAMLAAAVAVAALTGPAAGLAAVALAGAVALYDWVHKRTALAPLIMGAARALSYLVAAAAVAPHALDGGALDGHALAIGALGLAAHVAGLTYAARQEAYDRLGALWPLGVLAVPAAIALWLSLTVPLAAPFAVALLLVTALAIRRLLRRGPGDVPQAVVAMIAAIALWDATLIAAAGAPVAALAAAGCFGLTLALQRLVAGT